jgi:ATP-dependent DNA ligase
MAEPKDALCLALESGDFQTVQGLMQGFGEQIRAELEATSDPIERNRIITEAQTALTKYLDLARIARAHMRVQLDAVTGQARYHSSSTSPHSWRLDG